MDGAVSAWTWVETARITAIEKQIIRTDRGAIAVPPAVAV
jgi:hypothetical protein